MLKRYAIKTQSELVKKPKNTDSDEDKRPRINPENLLEKTKEVAKFLAITAIVAYGAVKTIDTLSEVVIKKTKSADNEK